MATTDEKCPTANPSLDRAAPPEGAPTDRRRRAGEILSHQRSQLDQFEMVLAEQLQQLADEVAEATRLAETTAQAQQGQSGAVEARILELDERCRTLAAETQQLRLQLRDTQVERARLEHELSVRDRLLKDAQDEVETRRVELANRSQRLADADAQLSASRERQDALTRQVAELRERATLQEEETKAQRRRLARELKQQRAEQHAETARRQVEHDTDTGGLEVLQQKLSAAQAELIELRAALAQGTSSAAENAEWQLRFLEQQAEHAAELERLRQVPAGADPVELASLKAERDKLAAQLRAAEAKVADGPKLDEQDVRKREDLQRRFEMAVDEVRELKRTVADLENKLKSRSGGAAPAVGGGGLDWEAQKLKLLASLEADDDDEEAVAERTTIEGTIRITDQIVAQKDREIAELKRQLEQLDSGAGNAAAVGEILDADEIIRQEREKLAQIRAEWREKIGQAEIDISVERAKVARDRAELDERMRQMQVDLDNRAPVSDSGEGGKPTRGRWLARLGLKDLDEEKK